jgi:SAM-dependent methyltransferase
MGIARWNQRYRSGDFERQASPLVIEATATLAPGRALDLACGAGRNAIHLADRGWRVVAVDGSIEALKLVRHPRIELHQIDLERKPLPFPDESFDLVCLIHFLHRPLFAEARRVLRPGGMIVTAIRTSGSHSLEPGALQPMFSDWKVVIDREGELAAIKGNESSDRSPSA